MFTGLSVSERVAVAGTLYGGSAFTADITVPYLGVPLNVVVAACIGVIAGFAFAAKIESRKQLFLVAFACVVLGCASTAIIDAVMRNYLKWKVEPQLLSAMALLISCLSRWVMPAIIVRIGPWLDKLPIIGKKGE